MYSKEIFQPFFLHVIILVVCLLLFTGCPLVPKKLEFYENGKVVKKIERQLPLSDSKIKISGEWVYDPAFNQFEINVIGQIWSPIDSSRLQLALNKIKCNYNEIQARPTVSGYEMRPSKKLNSWYFSQYFVITSAMLDPELKSSIKDSALSMTIKMDSVISYDNKFLDLDSIVAVVNR